MNSCVFNRDFSQNITVILYTMAILTVISVSYDVDYSLISNKWLQFLHISLKVKRDTDNPGEPATLVQISLI